MRDRHPHPSGGTNAARGMAMCNHRNVGPYGRIWAVFARVVLLGFALIEGSALLFDGLTLSTCLRRWAGLEDPEPCRHTTPGRAAVVAFAVWLAAHIGWRRFGIAGRPRAVIKR